MSRDSASPVRALLRQLPKVDAVLAREDVRALDAPRWAVVQAVRDEVEALRQAIQGGAPPGSLDIAPAALQRRIAVLTAPSLRRVINATGVVLHTNLGRAPLGAEALAAVAAVAAGYSNLEFDLATGQRGSRHDHVRDLLRQLTGAEDAVVVNNNAGAVLLALSALAADREVVVSRGELIEIGGSFRVPDVMRLSGARLVEVGTTNKTRAADYRAAAGEHTGLLLKVHPSNFAMVGFTEEVRPAELAALGRELGVPTMFDLGSGVLLAPEALAGMGLPAEPGVRQAVAAGLDVVSFSGDKLLGGPQAGILCGHGQAIARIRRHPLMRALRPDKMTLAALEATLAAYRDEQTGRADGVGDRLPAVAMLSEPAESVRQRARRVMARVYERIAGRTAGGLAEHLAGGPTCISIELVPCTATVGGGAMPTAGVPSWSLALGPDTARAGDPSAAVDAAEIGRRLRHGDPPVIGRMAGGRVLLDLRTVAEADIDAFVDALVEALVGAVPGRSLLDP